MSDPREFKHTDVSVVFESRRVAPGERQAVLAKINERRLNARVASFTCDRKEGEPSSVPRADGRGYARPAMWSHYGDRHKGVCFALNRTSLETALQVQFGGSTRYGNVEYTEGVDPSDESRYAWDHHIIELGEEGTVNKHFEDHGHKLLFEKNDDWKAEREWRWARCRCRRLSRERGLDQLRRRPQVVRRYGWQRAFDLGGYGLSGGALGRGALRRGAERARVRPVQL
jgi:hypothetical protein